MKTTRIYPYLLSVILILTVCPASGEIYSWENIDGSVSFTDNPSTAPESKRRDISAEKERERARIRELCRVYPEYEAIYYERLEQCNTNYEGCNAQSYYCRQKQEARIEACREKLRSNIAEDAARENIEAEKRILREVNVRRHLELTRQENEEYERCMAAGYTRNCMNETRQLQIYRNIEANKPWLRE